MQRAERLGLPLGDAGGGLVEAEQAGVEREQAGQLDDAAGAGRQLGDVACRRSGRGRGSR